MVAVKFTVTCPAHVGLVPPNPSESKPQSTMADQPKLPFMFDFPGLNATILAPSSARIKNHALHGVDYSKSHLQRQQHACIAAAALVVIGLFGPLLPS